MKFPAWIKVEGDRDYRGPCPSESSEQRDFFNAIRQRFPAVAMRTLHPRNEGKRTGQQVTREKLEGLLTGAPDIVIVGDPCIVIELKRRDHTQSAWQKNQLEILAAMQSAGAIVYAALGSAAALEVVKRHYPEDPDAHR